MVLSGQPHGVRCLYIWDLHRLEDFGLGYRSAGLRLTALSDSLLWRAAAPGRRHFGRVSRQGLYGEQEKACLCGARCLLSEKRIRRQVKSMKKIDK